MKLFKVIGSGLGGILCLVSSSIYAAPTSTTQSHFHPYHFYFDLGVGKSYDYAQSNSVVHNFNPAKSDFFVKSSSSYSTPFFFAGIGYRWAQPDVWFPNVNVGLQHRYTSPVNVNGEQPNGQLYSYRLQQESWLIMAKADIFQWKKIMPYITAGMGASFNRISQLFFNAALIENQLGGSTTLTGDFSYSIGAGIDYAVKDDLWLSLGYSYDDFGKNKVDTLFRADMEPFGTLKNANLHANSFFLSARYLFA